MRLQQHTHTHTHTQRSGVRLQQLQQATPSDALSQLLLGVAAGGCNSAHQPLSLSLSLSLSPRAAAGGGKRGEGYK